jgi:hypothetical protein
MMNRVNVGGIRNRLIMWLTAQVIAMVVATAAYSVSGQPISGQIILFIVLFAILLTWPLLFRASKKFLMFSPFITPALILIIGWGYGPYAHLIAGIFLMVGMIQSLLRSKITQEDVGAGLVFGAISLTIFVPQVTLTWFV